jgi:hypothetical protein
MHDDKRLIRKLKKEVKRSGNRKRRRYLKAVDAEPNDFEFGRNASAAMNDQTDRDRRG